MIILQLQSYSIEILRKGQVFLQNCQKSIISNGHSAKKILGIKNCSTSKELSNKVQFVYVSFSMYSEWLWRDVSISALFLIDEMINKSAKEFYIIIFIVVDCKLSSWTKCNAICGKEKQRRRIKIILFFSSSWCT